MVANVDCKRVVYESLFQELQESARMGCRNRLRDCVTAYHADHGALPCSQAIADMRQDLVQCALGELWERYSRYPDCQSMFHATIVLTALSLRYLPNWGQPAPEDLQPFLPTSIDGLTPRQSLICAAMASNVSDAIQARLFCGSDSGRAYYLLRTKQLGAVAALIAQAVINAPQPVATDSE